MSHFTTWIPWQRIIQTEDVRRLLLEFDELPFRNVNTTEMSTFSPGGWLLFLVGKRKQHKNCYREAFFIGEERH